jgi:hypothetical protein
MKFKFEGCEKDKFTQKNATNIINILEFLKLGNNSKMDNN